MPSVSHFFPINLRSLSGKPVAKTPPAISLEENGKHGDIMESNEHMGFMQKNTWDLTPFFHNNVGMEWDHRGYFTCFRLSSEQWTVMVVSVP